MRLHTLLKVPDEPVTESTNTKDMQEHMDKEPARTRT